jgi:hypothetical protein
MGPITIQDCRASCGCTSTNCPKGKQLQPGQSVDVEIRMTAGSRPRKISKTVTFRVVDQQPVILPVSVQVVEYVSVDPARIDPDEQVDGRMVIRAKDGNPFRIVDMSPPVITEFSEEAKVEHELFLDWDMWRDLGEGRRLVFNIEHPKCRKVTALIKKTVQRRFPPKPPRVQENLADQPKADAGDDLRTEREKMAERLREEGVVDKPLEPPAAPAKAAIAVKYGRTDDVKEQLEVADLDEGAINDLLHLAARHGRVEIMGLLIEAGADPAAMDKRGRTPLMSAVQSRVPDAMRYLLENGADVNARDQLEGTALVRAGGSFGNLESVQVLLSVGADVNVQDKNGMTPLMWAARWGDAPRVQALVKAGADVGARDSKGRTALDWARTRGDQAEKTIEVLQPLTESEAK